MRKQIALLFCLPVFLSLRYTSNSFAVGSHSFNAVYSGDTIYGQSASSPVTVTVSDFTLTTAAGISFTAGAPVHVSAIAAAKPPAPGVMVMVAVLPVVASPFDWQLRFS